MWTDLQSNVPYSYHRYEIPTPGGVKAYILITELDGNPHTLQVFIAKAGSDVWGWAYGYAKAISYMLQNLSLNEVIAVLSDTSEGIASYRHNPNSPNETRSVIEAIWAALNHYRSTRNGGTNAN